jgi:nucleoside-diphosphate-sugar epimerase
MIAVTGATGFIGSQLVADLGRDAAVRSIVRAGSTKQVGGEVRRVADLLDLAGMTAALHGARDVVHLAGRAHLMRDAARDPLAEFRRINVDGTVTVIEAAAQAGARRVLLASSLKAVGERSETPWTESTPPHPADAYGRSKLEAEQAARAAGERHGVEVVIMRFPLVYGPGAPANVARLLRLVDRGVPLPFGAVRNRRSLLFTGNLAHAVRRIITSPVAGRTFFLSDGHDLSTPDLIRTIARALAKPARLLSVPVPFLRLLGALGDVASTITRMPVTSAEIQRLTGSLAVDITALRSATGYEPPFTAEQGWAATAAWYRSAG